jgi:hypothetical protein
MVEDKVNNDSLAQLGERYLDRVEVAGSNPVGIIHFMRSVNPCAKRFMLFFYIGMIRRHERSPM